MPESSALKLPKNLKDELFKITKKSSAEDAVKELIHRELLRERNKHNFSKKTFEKKYDMTFDKFEESCKGKKLEYEKEKDYFDWDMAVTALDDINGKIEKMK